jgi:hypothetical protein
MNKPEATDRAKNHSHSAAPEHDNAPLAALMDAWMPSPQLDEIVGESLSKRDKRRLVSVVQQYQFDVNTPADRIAHYMSLAEREIAHIAPHLDADKIRQLWQFPPKELFSIRTASPNS